MDAAFNHPICVTSNYADSESKAASFACPRAETDTLYFDVTVFSCYQFVTEEHCSGTTPVPFGVCNRNGNDTSNALQNSSASVPALATKTARLAALGIGALLTVSVLLVRITEYRHRLFTRNAHQPAFYFTVIFGVPAHLAFTQWKCRQA